MISELKDDEILNFLMTSDLEDDYSPTELKYLLIKWRFFYRVLQGKYDRNNINYEGVIKQLEERVKFQESEKINLSIDSANKQNIIDGMKNRNLTFKERWSGKIIIEDEAKPI